MAMRWHKTNNKLRDHRAMSLTLATRGVLAGLEELLSCEASITGSLSQIAGWLSGDRKLVRAALDAIAQSGYLEITVESQGTKGTFYTLSYPQADPKLPPSRPQADPDHAPKESPINAGLPVAPLYRVDKKRIDNNPLTPKGDEVGPGIPSEEVPFSEPLLDEPDPEDTPDDDAPAWKKDAAFVAFWKAYTGPRKKSAAKSYDRWRRLKLTGKQLAAVLTALEEDKASKDWIKDEGQYIPAPEVWLSRKRWLDDPADASPSNVVPIRASLAVPEQYDGRPWSHLWTQEMRGSLTEAQHVEYLAGRTAHFYKTLGEREAVTLAMAAYRSEGLEAAMAFIWSHNPQGRIANA